MDLLRRRDRMAERWIDHAVATTKGRRADNQDRALAAPRWAVLSDGAGGHVGGAEAAQATVDLVSEALRSHKEAPTAEILLSAIQAAQAEVRRLRTTDPVLAKMAATVVCAAAVDIGPTASEWIVANAGDSPAWLVGRTKVKRLTADHTLTEALVSSGMIQREQAATHPGRSVLVRYIGTDEALTPDVLTASLRPGRSMVLGSDGLVEGVDDDRLLEIVSAAPTAREAAKRLMRTAVENGSRDNVTVVVLRHRDVDTAR